MRFASFQTKHPAGGLSAIEFLVATAVVAMLAAVSVMVFSGFKRNFDLNSSVEKGLSLLAEAKAQTLSSKNSSSYGAHFESGKMALFKGGVYSASNPENKEVVLPDNVEISCVSLNGGGSDVAFQRLTGATNEYGIVIFRLKDNPLETKTIAVLKSGAADLVEKDATLVGYWNFDEGTGNTIYDASGNGADGTLYNMEAGDWTTGKICGALEFNEPGAYDEYASIPSSADLDITGDLTLSLWVRPAVNSSSFHPGWNFFAYHKDPLKYEIGYYNTEGPRFKPYNDAGSDFDFSADAVFSAGIWRHVAFRRAGTVLEIYIDGGLADSRNDFTGNLRSAIDEIRIGGNGNSGGFEGAIDEVRIYSRALSPAEINRLYTIGI